MRKFLLVTLIGMVVTMDLYGLVNEYLDGIEKEEVQDTVYTVVYEE